MCYFKWIHFSFINRKLIFKEAAHIQFYSDLEQKKGIKLLVSNRTFIWNLVRFFFFIFHFFSFIFSFHFINVQGDPEYIQLTARRLFVLKQWCKSKHQTQPIKHEVLFQREGGYQQVRENTARKDGPRRREKAESREREQERRFPAIVTGGGGGLQGR